jgi:D-galactose 1-dehydrogenase/L-arabinose 1- dehydrogenase
MPVNSAPIPIALFGAGVIARAQHLPALAASADFRLVATADPHARLPGVPGFSSLPALLTAHPEVAAVAICTPPAVRAGLAADAIAAGLHVLLEKPPATTLSQARWLAGLAEAAGTTIFAAWHSRHAFGVAPARALLAGARIAGVRIEWREDITQWHPGQDWLLAAGGFGVFDPGINALSIATAILPEPVRLVAAHLSIPEGRQAPITARLDMRTGAAPVVADFDFLHRGAPCWTIEITTDRGRLCLHEGGRMIAIDGAAERGENTEYPLLYNHFAALIRAGASDLDTAPLQLVADAMLVGERVAAPAFDWG